MYTTINAARRHAHLSRRERQRLVRIDAFSRRTPATLPAAPVIAFGRAEIEFIDLLVRQDRTAVSSAVLAVAGIGTGEVRRRAVLAQVGEAASSAQVHGAISRERGAQLARHVRRALEGPETPVAA
jgi:hypothetical protein